MASDYKPTVHLPRTSFPMRANLAEREPAMLRQWSEERIYERLLEANRDRPKFVVHDRPKPAVGELQAERALNQVLKDVVAKYAEMDGHLVELVPEWDGHAIAIEAAVSTQLEVNKRALSELDFRRECRRTAENAERRQSESLQRLGIFMRWDQPLRTTQNRYEAQTVREFASLVERGFVQRRMKPVPWCPYDRTELAKEQLEIETRDTPSLYVALPLTTDPRRLHDSLAGEQVQLAIWTTSPWMLPATAAASVREDCTYVAYRLDDVTNPRTGRVLIVAMERLTSVLAELAPGELRVRDAARIGVTEAAVLRDPSKILAFIEGSALAGHRYRNPLIDRDSPILMDNTAEGETGTGIVPVVPDHVRKDADLAAQHHLDVLSPLDEEARFTPPVEFLTGVYFLDANPVIIERLRTSGHLLSPPDLTAPTPAPVCWRCHNPVVFRAIEEWVLSLAHDDLRRRCIDAVERDISWFPGGMKEGVHRTLLNSSTWSISRQRRWGVPLVSFSCLDCGHTELDPKLMRHVADIFERESSDAWLMRSEADFLPAGYSCPRCEGRRIQKGSYSLDPAFGAALSTVIASDEATHQGTPADVMMEPAETGRRTFSLSLLASIASRRRVPVRAAVTHSTIYWQRFACFRLSPFTMDEVVMKRGAELHRLWTVNARSETKTFVSRASLDEHDGAYRRIRNTLRFALGNLSDFDPTQHSVPVARLTDLDRWALEMTARYVDEVREAYRTYEFHRVVKATLTFCKRTHSAFYFDVLKDRLYTRATNDPMRRGSQTVLWTITDALCRMLAPILTFTADEAYRALPGHRHDSVFLAGLPSSEELRKGLAPGEGVRLVEKYEVLQSRVRAPVQKALEELKTLQQPLFKEFKELDSKADLSPSEQGRKTELAGQLIGSSLDAQVVLRADSKLARVLTANEADLPELLIVSQVRIETREGASEGLSVEVSPASGDRCARCWCYTVSRGMTPVHPELCPKCTSAVLTDYPNGLPAAAQV